MNRLTVQLRTALLVAATIAAPLGAQEQVKLTAPNYPGGTPIYWDYPGTGAVYVSPYTGVLMTTNQTVVMNCVDFFHHATLNTEWSAYRSYLNSGNLSHTRFNNVQAYLQAAWLTTQYPVLGPDGLDAPPYSADEINRTIAIQSAIWNIFAGGSPDMITGANPANDQFDSAWWINQSLLNWNTVDASRFFVLTATNAFYSSGADNPNSSQEFLVYDSRPTTVPEPATLALLGTGMIFVRGISRRRRAKSAS